MLLHLIAFKFIIITLRDINVGNGIRIQVTVKLIPFQQAFTMTNEEEINTRLGLTRTSNQQLDSIL